MRSTTYLFVLSAMMAAIAPAQTLPVLTGISPSTVGSGGPAFNLTVNGSSFVSGATVFWNASPLVTTFASTTQLIANVPAARIATVGVATVQVGNPDGGQSGLQQIFIVQAQLIVTTDTLPPAVAGTPYTGTVIATGGTPPYSWSLAGGVLPGGLNLDSATGTISGTPVNVGIYSIPIRVTDRSQNSAQKTIQLLVNTPSFSITNASPLPTGIVGTPYSQQFNVVSGSGGYRWSSTQLPGGLALNTATGVMSGTPTASGSFTFLVQVADSTGQTTSKSYAMTINPSALSITTLTVFTGTVGQAYSQTFAAAGGVAPYRWVLTGTLGNGLTFDAASSSIVGTPQAAGSFAFTIQVTDNAGATASRTYTLAVSAPTLNILTASPLPNGTVGIAYSQRLAALGGTAPLTWSITTGSVPGLLLDEGGGLTGSPTTAGTYNLSINVKDSVGAMATKAFALTIAPSALTITSSRDLSTSGFGDPLTRQLEASGGVPPYTWTANGLPDGLSIDSATGVISGTPATPGNFSFTVRVSDSVSTTAVDLFRLAVNFPNLPGLVLTGLPATSDPASQPRLQLALAAPIPLEITGQLNLTFVPESGGADPAIQFSSGGRSVPFTIPANTTSAVFAGSGLGLQTGTVAGVINLSAQLRGAGVDLTPSPAPAYSTKIDRGAPVISRVSVTRSATGLSVQVTGYSTAREVNQAVFQFSAAGRTLQAPSVTIGVDTLFGPWFQDLNSARFGSQFTFTQQFNIQGDAAVVNVDSVTLTNRVGSTTGRP